MRRTLLLLLLLAGAAVAVLGVFLFGSMGTNWEYILSRRLVRVGAMVLTAGCIGVSSLLFQTITGNRILTPSVIGLDSLYLFVQTTAVFFGSHWLHALADPIVNYAVSLSALGLFAVLLAVVLFQRAQRDLFRVLLIGMVLGTFFGSLTTFMQVLLDPNEFLTLQARMFASMNRVNAQLLVPSFAVLVPLVIGLVRWSRTFDVLALGRETAIALGVDYRRVITVSMLGIALAVAVATALVGPLTFLGIVVTNLTYQVLRTWRHRELLVGVLLVSIVAVVGGQLVVERVFAFATPLNVVVNLIGGIYFFVLLLRERVVW